ncbi:helix-turn-helix transcriptional regulator [Trueperella pyogenes]|uniref:helix-turn-helix transcriptional regulator n=1 Tax=Trueperella pyogenes TaxID=1661 RepID=UPI00345D916D
MKLHAPHIALPVVRRMLGLTQADLAREVSTILNREISQGTISAIENGERGASQEMVDALAAALDLPAGAVTTSYRPRQARRRPRTQLK